jgi:hypothetical protein
MLMPEPTANIWLLDEAACNERSGRQEPPDKGENKDNCKSNCKSNYKSKNAAKGKTSSRAGRLAYANGLDCVRNPQKPEKQKQFIA